MKPTVFLVVLAACVALLSSCGGEGDTTVIEDTSGDAAVEEQVEELERQLERERREEAQTVTEAAPQPQPEPEPEAASGSVPDVVGERLDVAKRDMKAAGYTTRTVGGGLFGVVLPENWVVCDQEPAGGSSAPSGTKVDLTVDRSC